MCIEAYYVFSGSKMVICQENLLIMKAVFMFLVEPHTNPTLIMLLKSTSVDGKDHNGKEAGETLPNSFYDDHLFKICEG